MDGVYRLKWASPVKVTPILAEADSACCLIEPGSQRN